MSRASVIPLILILSLATGAVVLSAGAVFGSASSPIASGRGNGDVVRHFYTALNEAIRTGDVTPLDALVAPNFVDHPARPNDISPRAALLQAVLALHAKNPDFRIEVTSVAAEGDTVTVRTELIPGVASDAHLKGTSGSTAVAFGIDVFRIQSGLIVEHWGIGDAAVRCGGPIALRGGLAAAQGRSFGMVLSLNSVNLDGVVHLFTPRWQVNGSAVSAEMVVANGAVYAAGWDGAIRSLDAATGAERWRVTGVGQVPAHPVVSAGSVYVATINGWVYAIEATTGRVQWRSISAGLVGRGLSFGDGLVFVMSGTAPAPTVVDGVAYAVIGEVGSTLQALDAETGTERWRIYLTDQALYSIETSSLRTRWKLPLDGESVSSPLVADRAVYVVADDLYGVDAETGRVRWQNDGAAGLRSFPATGEGLVFLTDTDGRLRAIDGETGVERWVVSVGGAIVSAPVVADGVVHLGSRDGQLYAFDAATGMACGQISLGGIVSTPAVVDRIAYVGTMDGRLVAVSLGEVL